MTRAPGTQAARSAEPPPGTGRSETAPTANSGAVSNGTSGFRAESGASGAEVPAEVSEDQGASARERILSAAGALFAESGFDATPTSRIAERAQVPKGLIHYYFRRKHDLLIALVDRLPDETVDAERIAAAEDVAGSLRRLVAELDRKFESSVLLSHLLWREADTHAAVRQALRDRFHGVVGQIRQVISAALPAERHSGDIETAAYLLARVVNHRHAVARHGERDVELEREIDFIARALESASQPA